MICDSPIQRGKLKGQPARGTLAGYDRHHVRGEVPCDECREAKRVQSAKWRAQNPEKEREFNRKWKRLNADQKREADRRYREENRERIRGFSRRWYYDNKEKAAEHVRRWQENNPEARREIYRRYQQNNPEAFRNKNNRRRARLLAAPTVVFSVEELQARMAFWGNRCWMCGGDYESIDHVKPVSKGGPHMLSNLRPSCRSCNSAKADRWPFEVAS